MTTPQRSKPNWAQITSLVISGVMAVVVVGMVPLVRQVIANTRDLVAIKSNRYTNSDALKDQKELRTELTQIRESLRDINGKIPLRIPPQWFEDRVNKIEKDLEEIKRLVK